MLSKNKIKMLVLLLSCSSISLGCSANSSTGIAEKNPEQLQAVLALQGDPEYGAYLAGDCLTCHAPTQTNGAIPQIHGKDKGFLASALLEYKNKQRASEVMRGVATALSNEEMAALIIYLSKQ